MILARRFNAGDQVFPCSRRIATIEFDLGFQASLRDVTTHLTFPAFERPG
jgi:hypothetical protein